MNLNPFAIVEIGFQTPRLCMGMYDGFFLLTLRLDWNIVKNMPEESKGKLLLHFCQEYSIYMSMELSVEVIFTCLLYVILIPVEIVYY